MLQKMLRALLSFTTPMPCNTSMLSTNASA
jgi:hypothetical protein